MTEQETAPPETQPRDADEKIYDLLTGQDEVTWKDLLFDILSEENMDPWDVSIAKLTHKYIESIKKMKKLDMNVSAKVVMAATYLLRYKSKKLVGEDLDEFDRLLAQQDEPEFDTEEFYEDLARMRDPSQIPDIEKMKLIPRMPQPRQRKVSIYDLVGALEKALEVKKRRILRTMPELKATAPARGKNIEVWIKETYKHILLFFRSGIKRLTFSRLFETEPTKLEKIHTFNSLLYLYQKEKIDLIQTQHFGEIDVTLKTGGSEPSNN